MSPLRALAPVFFILLAMFIIGVLAMFSIPQKKPKEACVKVRENVTVCDEEAVRRWKQ